MTLQDYNQSEENVSTYNRDFGFTPCICAYVCNPLDPEKQWRGISVSYWRESSKGTRFGGLEPSLTAFWEIFMSH